MTTLLLTPRFTPDSNQIRSAAIDAGWEVVRLERWHVPEALLDRELAFYGEPLLAAVLAETMPYVLLEPPFGWLPALPEELRKRDVRLSTLGEARRHGGRAFIKPADDKCFPAAVYASGAVLPTPDVLPESILVLLAEPVTWEIEFRCFVRERQIATSSPYLRNGELVETEDGDWPAEPDEIAGATAFAKTVLADARVAIPPAVTLDVGRIAGRGWAVIEANAAWGSGIYGCDPARILPVCGGRWCAATR